MKTTLDIPEAVLKDSMKWSGAKTKRAAVLQALEEFNRRASMRDLAQSLGDSDSFMSSEQLSVLRSQEVPHDAR